MTANIEQGNRKKYAITLPKVIDKVDAKDYDKTLLFRLGGAEALEAVLELFINGILEDEYLRPFFDNVHPALLKFHQKKFLSLALTEIPPDFNAKAYIIERHYRLFERGLNETHFDKVVGHLEAALSGMWVEPKLIAETKARVSPLREIFAVDGRSGVREYLREAVGNSHYDKIQEARARRASVL